MYPATTETQAAPWRGYRWPLAAKAEWSRSTPAWHWPIAALLLTVIFGVIDLNRVFAVDTGPVRVYGNDLVFAFAMVLAIFSFVGSSRRPVALGPTFQGVLIAAGLMAVLAAVMLVRDFSQSLGILGNTQGFVRQLPYFMSFFLVLAFISGEQDLLVVLRLWFAIAAAGTAIVILQSLRGPGDLFGGSLLDQVRVPPGPQITEVYGIFSRSNFPITFAAVWCCFFCLAALLQRPSVPAAAGVFWFSAAWILNMSRGLYIGIALAFITCLLVLLATRALRPAVAVLGIAGVGAALFLTSVMGLGGLNDAVVVRGASAWQEYRLNTGTWASRLAEADAYFALEPGGDELLLGMGYTGTRSGLDRPFLEFGPVDLLYRGGLLGAAVLAGVLLIYCRGAIRAVQSTTRPLVICAGVATLCSVVSEIGQLPSANHFYYIYYAAVLGAAVAVTAAAHAVTTRRTA